MTIVTIIIIIIIWIEEDRVLGGEQSGFRKGRGNLENVLVMKEVREEYKVRKRAWKRHMTR